MPKKPSDRHAKPYSPEPAAAAPPKKRPIHHDPQPLPSGLMLLGPSWRAFWLNLAEVVKLGLMPVAPLIIAGLLFYIAARHQGTQLQAIINGLAAVAGAASVVLALLITPAFALIQLRSARNEVAEFWEEFLTGLPLAGRYIAVSLVSGIVMVVGLLLLVVPGFFAIRRYSLAPYYVLEREAGVVEAMRLSARDALEYRQAMTSFTFVQLFFRALVLLRPVGLLASVVLQTLYSYAAAIRYVEITESQQERSLAQKHHLAPGVRRRRHRR